MPLEVGADVDGLSVTVSEGVSASFIMSTVPQGTRDCFSTAALLVFLRQRVNAGRKARRRGRVGGRPKALTEADFKKARALLRSGDYAKVQAAEDLKISRYTLWRALSQEVTK